MDPENMVIETSDAGDPDLEYLVTRLQKRSHGALFVSLADSYASSPATEAALVRAVRSGKVDYAIVPARAWPAGGVPAFAALQAPFVIGTYDAARAALAGPAGTSLMTSLKRAGVMPLALVPTELRRVLATRALTTPESFRGARVRIADNPVTADVLSGLGARPRQGLSGDDVGPALKAHRLDGAETPPWAIVGNQYWRGAKHLTSYALYDKVFVFVASATEWKRLSAAHQAEVRAAAADLVRHAAILDGRDDDEVATLCRKGVRLEAPTAAELRALARAEAPVLAALERNPAAGPVLRQLRATPGAGPKALTAPKACAP